MRLPVMPHPGRRSVPVGGPLAWPPCRASWGDNVGMAYGHKLHRCLGHEREELFIDQVSVTVTTGFRILRMPG